MLVRQRLSSSISVMLDYPIMGLDVSPDGDSVVVAGRGSESCYVN